MLDVLASYQGAELLPYEQFRARLRAQPCVPQDEVLDVFAYRSKGGRVPELVDVSRIVVNVGDSWDMTDRGRPGGTVKTYVWDLIQAVLAGRLPIADRSETIDLFEVGGWFGIMANGRHRVSAVKGLLGDNLCIPADVSHLDVPEPQVALFLNTLKRFGIG